MSKAAETAQTAGERGTRIDALVALAEDALGGGRDVAAASALAEAEALFPSARPKATVWRARAIKLYRAKAALAQRAERHADAVAAFEAALAAIRTNSADRDNNAGRLQLLVRLARSRFALGQAAEADAEVAECEALAAALAGKIPARAVDTMRAAILRNAGVARAMLGRRDAAEAAFTESVAVIDRLATPGLAALRRQVLDAWESTRGSVGSP